MSTASSGLDRAGMESPDVSEHRGSGKTKQETEVKGLEEAFSLVSVGGHPCQNWEREEGIDAKDVQMGSLWVW